MHHLSLYERALARCSAAHFLLVALADEVEETIGRVTPALDSSLEKIRARLEWLEKTLLVMPQQFWPPAGVDTTDTAKAPLGCTCAKLSTIAPGLYLAKVRLPGSTLPFPDGFNAVVEVTGNAPLLRLTAHFLGGPVLIHDSGGCRWVYHLLDPEPDLVILGPALQTAGTP
jgi:hypothetical protein